MFKKCSKMPFGASWQLPRKMSKKCPCAGVGAGKMSRKCQKNVPQTFSRHFFDIFWQIENQKGARARSARAPPFGWRPKAATPLFAKKCQKSLLKMSGVHFFDIFWTFFQRQSQHQDTFQTLFGHFSGRLPGSPKRHFGIFFIFQQFLVLTSFTS